MSGVVQTVAAGIVALGLAGVVRADENAFFRIVSSTGSVIRTFGGDGVLVWSNAAVGGMCTVQRAAVLSSHTNWVDFVRHAATGDVVYLRVLDFQAPSGMAYIPAGSFSMGDSVDGLASAQPVHTVCVSAFYMDKAEVTKAKWDDVAGWAATNGYDLTTDGASGKAPNHPAHYVTWHECVKWCNAYSQKEGLTPCYTVGGATFKTGDNVPDCDWSANGFRLPTEAEWEKAARGGLSGTRFPWGDTITHSRANYYSFWSDGAPLYPYDLNATYGYHPTYNDGKIPFTSPAGAFEANGYGLYDMSGNVWEWCWDWYGSAYYSGAPSSDPQGPSSGSYRVIRGGGWSYHPSSCRAAHRYSNTPTYSGSYLGFRSVRRVP